jgi:hypothetical protein
VITLEEFIIDTFTRVDENGIERPVDRSDEVCPPGMTISVSTLRVQRSSIQIGGGGSYGKPSG